MLKDIMDQKIYKRFKNNYLFGDADMEKNFEQQIQHALKSQYFLDELMPPHFIYRYTKLENVHQLLQLSGCEEDNLDECKLDQFLLSCTADLTWNELLRLAVESYFILESNN